MHIYTYTCTFPSVPVGVGMHGLERVLVSREKREEIRRDKYQLRRDREQQWWVSRLLHTLFD